MLGRRLLLGARGAGSFAPPPPIPLVWDEEELATTNVADYGAVGNGSADDTTAIQDAIDATPVGGRLVLPFGTYRLTDTLVIDHPMTLAGSGVTVLHGSQSVAWDSINMPTVSPYVAGAILLMDAEATDVISLPGPGVTVNLRDFGIRFATPYVNTGHGIVAVPPAYDGHLDNGLMSARWDNLVVYGHDGDHYAYKFANPICSMLAHLQSFGGGGMSITNNSWQGFYGNLVVEALYSCVYVGGTAHGVHLIATALQLNLMAFIRPQVNVVEMPTSGAVVPDGMAGVAHPTDAQYRWKCDAGVEYIVIVAGDFETTTGSPTDHSDSTTQLGLFEYSG